MRLAQLKSDYSHLPAINYDTADSRLSDRIFDWLDTLSDNMWRKKKNIKQNETERAFYTRNDDVRENNAYLVATK